jgi:hypothetical protein
VRPPFALLLFGIPALLWTLGSGCVPSVTYRYRLAVEVDTPQGPRSGASVIETTRRDATGIPWYPPEARKISSQVRGEAVFVDLGEGRNVVAIMARGPRGDEGIDFDWLVPHVLGLQGDAADAQRLQRPGVFEVPARLLPTLVTFANPSDPKSARVVRTDEFGTVFGPGVRFGRAYR